MRVQEDVALDGQEADRRFKVCDGCGKERHVGQWRIRRLLTAQPVPPRQVGLCDDCSRPLRAADAVFPEPRKRRRKLA